MFGYITINKPELKVREYNRYRAGYCGLCRGLRSAYGVMGELTLTYDMTFLILLLHALYEDEETIVYRRCAAHPLRKHAELLTRFDAYGADMNLLLAYYKQKDDAADDGSLRARVCSAVLKRKAGRIGGRYPAQSAVIVRELAFLRDLENSGRRDPEAGARSFGRLLGRIFVPRKDEWAGTLYAIGYYLGMYIYLADAWNDLEEDLRTGAYNPLPFTGKTKGREEALRRFLVGIMAKAAGYFERLPVLQDAEILRNILYSGVWTSFGKPMQKGFLRNGKGPV